MIRWTELDRAAVPDGGGELRLLQRGQELSIIAGATELMNSRLSGSEEGLAALARARLPEGSRAPVLVGGLGMGFTLRAALAEFGPETTVEVWELVPAVVRWARGPMAGLFGDSLSDRRVSLHEGDVAQAIRSASGRYAAILLDVDNGPEGLTRAANDGLYDLAGLSATRRALRPGGVLGVWSAGPHPAFTQRLRKAGFAVEEVRVRARAGRGARHTIWLATAPSGRPPEK